MDRINPAVIAAALLAAPAWVRIGLTVRDERLRLRAADVLAATIAEQIAERAPVDPDQLILPIE